MAFNPLPQTWLTGLTDDGTTLSLPISSIPQLTAPEADSVTGDIRKVVFALMELLYSKWNALVLADRPKQMTFSKSVYTDVATGIVTNTYTVTCKTSVSVQEVIAET